MSLPTNPGIPKTVCVVDDDEFMREYLSDVLSDGGYDCVTFSNGSAACRWITSGETPVDLLLSDVIMPGMSGLDLLSIAKAINPRLPIIVFSGGWDHDAAQSAVRAGATDCLAKPCSPEDLLSMVSRHTGWMAANADECASIRQELSHLLGAGHQSCVDPSVRLLAIFDAVGSKRYETAQHSRRVAASALLIGRRLGLNCDALKALEVGSLLHDIGKAAIPRNVLMKPGTLSDREWQVMKMHPGLGLDLLSGIAGHDREKEIVYSHHERFDGKGYPKQLVGQSIPLFARIFSVVDTLDAMTTDRCYRPAQSFAASRAEIHRQAGSQFDPAIVEVFDRVADEEFELIRRQFPD